MKIICFKALKNSPPKLSFFKIFLNNIINTNNNLKIPRKKMKLFSNNKK